MLLDAKEAPAQRRLLLGGKIVFNNKSSVFDCIVRALSAGGAELQVKSSLGVPDQFHLRIEATGDVHFCSVTSRTQTELGVEFIGQVKQAAPAGKKKISSMSW